MGLFKNWRPLVLALLFAGPFLVYVGFGFLWLLERGWIWPTLAGVVWMLTGVAFSLLASRWTRRTGRILPYLDENAPESFSPRDHEAWAIIQQAAADSDTLEASSLIELDRYVDAAKSLALRVAQVYNPGSANPVDHVPLLEALTALELAANDLSTLSREIPGSDLVTPSHVKAAVQAAGYLQKASEWYGYILPLINPATGLPRLASQHLMVRPAWRDMQHNVLRWFYRAFTIRLGVHLIELYSGRLVVGAESYRKLMKASRPGQIEAVEESHPLRIGVAGSQYSGSERLIEAFEHDTEDGRQQMLRASESKGLDFEMVARLVSGEWIAVPHYLAHSDGSPDSWRDRSRRRKAVDVAVETDLLVLVIDDRSEGRGCDVDFLEAWKAWFTEHTELQMPPVVVLVTHADETRIEALREMLPIFVDRVVPIELASLAPFERLKAALPLLQPLVPRVERCATIRRLSRESSRSKAGRLMGQLGRHGRRLLWTESKKTSE